MSIRSIRVLAMLAVVLGGTPLARAVTWDSAEFMPVDELRRGMQGHILTIVEDSRIDRLPIEILSVETNAFAKGDLIWAKGLGDILGSTGAAQGMSGSPVYVDGRLVGAFALGFAYAREPLLGITPIRQMLELWDRDMRPVPRTRRPVRHQMGFMPFEAPSGWTRESGRETRHAIAVPDEALRSRPALDPLRGMRAERPGLPVSLRGVAAGAMDTLSSLFAGAGMQPFASIGGGRVDLDAPVTPGSTIGTEYIRGDMSAFAFGTLTYRDRAKVLAFGHPNFGEGDTYLPLSAGYVHFLVSSHVISRKYGSPTRIVGTMTQDREYGIAGIISDDHPPYLPLAVTVRPNGGEPREYNYEVLRHPQYTGGLVQSAVWSTLDSAEKAGGDFTVRTKATVTFDAGYGREPLVKSNVMSGSFSPGFAASTALSAVSSILNNWYDEIPIDRVDLDVEFGDARQAAAITSARVTRQRARPGQSVVVSVTFLPYLDEPVVKSYTVDIPADAPEGFTLVFVGDENSYLSWERSRAAKKYQPSNAEQLLEVLGQGGGGDRLVISLISSRMGVAVAGEELPLLPLSMLNVMNASVQSGESNLTRGSVIAETTFTAPFDRPYVVNGGTLLSFFIDRDAP